ncbi:substrate-binding domain-containing protein [Shewanella sp. TC10]|uniref:substrate-binding domain-containing protein n=1 Tax=Shewanella sp. TC10 TaxID=1419739 RepID=UPI001E34CAFB|nr:phosphate ABC transporter substrate-binding/OmpA family protein [Shewanella sp. TC10]
MHNLSGTTQAKSVDIHQNINVVVNELSQHLRVKYDIKLNQEKTLLDKHYRAAVLRELKSLNDTQVNDLLDTIAKKTFEASNEPIQTPAQQSIDASVTKPSANTTSIPRPTSIASPINQPQVSNSADANAASLSQLNTAKSNTNNENQATVKEQTKTGGDGPKDGNKKAGLWGLLMLGLVVAAGLLFWQQESISLYVNGIDSSAKTVEQSPEISSQQTRPIDTLQAQDSVKTETLIPAQKAELLFRLHGSNTIGEKLAPALLEAFFAQQGFNEFTWVQGESSVERTMEFNDNGVTKAVELHAHGSGTAFKGMLSGVADIGMASRPIKAKELTQTKATLGDLSRVGNEHIIGLDGLAIIVNQNSPLKSMSISTLSKIYSGEITNWAQIGQGEGQIELFSRDNNSGTWDTFNKLVLKKAGKTLSETAKRYESSSQLSEQVSQNENAIGFIGLNYIGHNKALAITEGMGATPIYPTKFTVSTEDYALSRRLYMYTPTSSSALVKDFAQFAISKEGQVLVNEVGLISQNINLQKVYATEGAPESYNRFASQGQRLSLNFRFNHGNGELDNKGQRDLARLIEFIENNPGRRIVLMGFSDSSGAKLSNQQLSLRRAKAVENEIVSRGIPVMSVEAYGELLPVANNDTSTGRERNRRVEVWVI